MPSHIYTRKTLKEYLTFDLGGIYFKSSEITRWKRVGTDVENVAENLPEEVVYKGRTFYLSTFLARVRKPKK